MKIRKDVPFKTLIVCILFVYVYFLPIGVVSNKIDALGVLFMSGLLLFKGRKNLALTLMFVFIFYVNYSIVIGEYIVGNHLSVPFTAVKTIENYGLTIRILLIFMTIFALFYKENQAKLENIKINPKNNPWIYGLIIIATIVVLVVGVERGEYSTYGVRISALFEYSKILFLFAFYFSSNSKGNKILLMGIMAIFVLQDVYYGGRITAMQILILATLVFFLEKMSFTKIIRYSIIGIIFNSLVAAYRTNYMLFGIKISQIVKNMILNFFVFDTATYAYYASATHVAAAQEITWNIRLQSAFEFLKSTIGIQNSSISDVTTFVAKEYYYNMGGGLIPTFFYFWFGWLGVIAIAIFVVTLINSLVKRKSDFSKLLLYAIIMNSPRWYLYSPNQLFRGAIWVISVLYLVTWVGRSFTKKETFRIREIE